MEDIPAVDDLINQRTQAFADQGIDLTWFIKQLKEKAENAKITRIASHEGKITDERSYNDNRTQLIAIDKIGKAAGYYPSEKHDIRGNFHIAPNLTPEDRELLTKFSDRVVDAILDKHRKSITGD